MEINSGGKSQIIYEPAGKFEETRFEKIHNISFEKSTEASAIVAQEIADLIRSKEAAGEKCVLGLATGSSPINVYAELVRMHNQEGLSFKNVITFNLDEYWPMDKSDVQSYHYFMHEHLFNHVDIPADQVNIP
ncbi:6-phosphogluconolactonase, partial [Leeuwenhoekiella marinoflava]